MQWSAYLIVRWSNCICVHFSNCLFVRLAAFSFIRLYVIARLSACSSVRLLISSFVQLFVYCPIAVCMIASLSDCPIVFVFHRIFFNIVDFFMPAYTSIKSVYTDIKGICGIQNFRCRISGTLICLFGYDDICWQRYILWKEEKERATKQVVPLATKTSPF